MSANDFTFSNHGSIWLCLPKNKAADKHLHSHVSRESQWFGDALVVEPRFVRDLAERLDDAGFQVGGDRGI